MGGGEDAEEVIAQLLDEVGVLIAQPHVRHDGLGGQLNEVLLDEVGLAALLEGVDETVGAGLDLRLQLTDVLLEESQLRHTAGPGVTLRVGAEQDPGHQFRGDHIPVLLWHIHLRGVGGGGK